MPLTDTAIRNAKPKDKQYKLSDEKGLYLLVKKAGKYFRLNYRFAGKRKTLAIGVYPDVTLAEARKKRDGQVTPPSPNVEQISKGTMAGCLFKNMQRMRSKNERTRSLF